VEESFRIFQGRILEQYEAMIEEMGFHVIDASRSIEEQQFQMRRIVMEQLGDAVASGQILNQEGTVHAYEAATPVL
jgi:dTMP kinase